MGKGVRDKLKGGHQTRRNHARKVREIPEQAEARRNAKGKQEHLRSCAGIK